MRILYIPLFFLLPFFFFFFFVVAMGAEERTHYQALGVAEDATYAQIRASYLSSLLCLHPDKQSSTGPLDHGDKYSVPASSSHVCPPGSFLRIQEAWNVLKDPTKRASYDLHLVAKSCSRIYDGNNVIEHVSLTDMNMETCPPNDDDDDGGLDDIFYEYPCRCGDFFSISQKELNESGFEGTYRHDHHPGRSLILPCSSCSLRIELTFPM